METVTERWEMPSPSGAGSVIRRTARQHAGVVGERLAHPHEHDVGDPARPAGHLAAGQRPRRRHHLRRRSRRWTGCGSARPGRSRRTGSAIPQPACEDTHIGDPVRVAHQHRLDAARRRTPATGSCGSSPGRRLSSRSAVSSRGSSAAASASRSRGGQVGHLRRIVGQPGEIVPGQLVGPERRLPELGDGRPAAGRIQVGQMTRRPPAHRNSSIGCAALHARRGTFRGIPLLTSASR